MKKTTLYRIGSLRHTNAMLYNIDQYTWSNEDITVLGVTISHEDIINKNYQPLIDKSRKVLNAWYNRGLSLQGKINVVNTLVASLFVYKMMVLPTIPHTIVKCIDNIIREFLWNGKKAKIAYKILQNPKYSGGLNLVNLKNKDIALKATWPAILQHEEDYAKMVYGMLRCKKLQENIWRCHILPEDVQQLKIQNTFWKDVWKSWSEYNYHKGMRIDNQIIWYNSNIRIKNKPVMWNDVFDRGLLYIHQLYQDMQLKSDKQVWEQYGLTTLRYNSLNTSIPTQWKNFFSTTPCQCYFPIAPHEYDNCISSNKQSISNRVYKYIKWRHITTTQQEFKMGTRNSRLQ